MPLTDITIKNKKPEKKPYKLSDDKGMYLLVTPAGGKLWRLKYRYLGKEKLLALGSYPEVSLLDARERRENARKQLANGIDPSQAKKDEKHGKLLAAENTFETVAREWHRKFKITWKEKHAARLLRRLEVDIFPSFGKRPISELEPHEVLSALRKVEERTLEIAHKLRISCDQIFRYAVSSGKAKHNIISDLKGALPPAKTKHMPAIIEPEEVAPLLRAIDEYKGGFLTRCALQLAPLVFLRPGELRQGEWSEIDFDKALWTITGEKMKMENDHIIPLSTQAINILRALHDFTGHGKYLFPSNRSTDQCMSDNTINKALRVMGYDTKEQMTGHGFRAMARTILDEVLEHPAEHIELQLAHAVKDANGRAYNRTKYLKQRTIMMQEWADYLDELKIENALK